MKKFTENDLSREAQQILQILKKEKIDYRLEYTFPDLTGLKGVPFRFDFAIFSNKKLTALIEYDSILHFDKNNKLVKNYRHYRENDLKKNRYALTHNIPLYRITCWDLPYIKEFQDLFKSEYKVKSIWHNYDIARKHGLL